MINETDITRLIVKNYMEELLNHLSIDVAIVGAGPAGLVAANYLAMKGKKVVVFERKISPGGGMWGGGMNYPIIVLKFGKEILDDIGIKYEEQNGYYVANAIEATSKLIASAMDAGAKIYNGITVEDVMVKNGKVNGVVINWSTILMTELPVDPLSIEAKAVIDATGHDCYVSRIIEAKYGIGHKIEGEKGMWAEEGEKMTVERSGEIFPGLYVAGMAANAVSGSPRMGPIFGGMLQSGKKVAELILQKI